MSGAAACSREQGYEAINASDLVEDLMESVRGGRGKNSCCGERTAKRTTRVTPVLRSRKPSIEEKGRGLSARLRVSFMGCTCKRETQKGAERARDCGEDEDEERSIPVYTATQRLATAERMAARLHTASEFHSPRHPPPCSAPPRLGSFSRSQLKLWPIISPTSPPPPLNPAFSRTRTRIHHPRL